MQVVAVPRGAIDIHEPIMCYQPGLKTKLTGRTRQTVNQINISDIKGSEQAHKNAILIKRRLVWCVIPTSGMIVLLRNRLNMAVTDLKWPNMNRI